MTNQPSNSSSSPSGEKPKNHIGDVNEMVSQTSLQNKEYSLGHDIAKFLASVGYLKITEKDIEPLNHIGKVIDGFINGRLN